MAEFILRIALAVVAIFAYEVMCWLAFDEN